MGGCPHTHIRTALTKRALRAWLCTSASRSLRRAFPPPHRQTFDMGCCARVVFRVLRQFRRNEGRVHAGRGSVEGALLRQPKTARGARDPGQHVTPPRIIPFTGLPSIRVSSCISKRLSLIYDRRFTTMALSILNTTLLPITRLVAPEMRTSEGGGGKGGRRKKEGTRARQTRGGSTSRYTSRPQGMVYRRQRE